MKEIKNEKGQAVVEFAMILPLLLLLIMGIIQFGMMINAFLSIQNAAREGARAGCVGKSYIEVDSRIRAVTPTLNANDLSIVITPREAERKSGEALTVTISYNYFLTLPIIDKIFSAPILLQTHTSMRIE